MRRDRVGSSRSVVRNKFRVSGKRAILERNSPDEIRSYDSVLYRRGYRMVSHSDAARDV